MFRNILVMVLIIAFLIIISFALLAGIHTPCLANYYNQMPVYPRATITSQSAQSLNWIGFGQPETIFVTEDDSATVQAWFTEEVDTLVREAHRARVANEPVPEFWQGDYAIIPTNAGIEINLTIQCLK